MNLFKLNAQLAVKLGQSFDTLYNLEYLEYSLLLNILNDEIDDHNEDVRKFNDSITKPGSPLKVNLPSHINLK